MSSTRRLVRCSSRVLTAVRLASTCVIPSLYLTVVTVAGLPRRRARQPQALPITRFAVLVPAHDEQAVIADALEAFHRLDYDDRLFEVHVVADNCSDRTADIVRASGWNVHERDAPDDPGKGPALNWLMDRLDGDPDHRFDVAAIVDADSVVDPAFLREMSAAFVNGADVAQGYYSVRNPEDSANAALRYAALACRHHLRPLGRCRIGASAGLYGNGMAFRWWILQRHRWTGHLVEDAELQMELLVRDGIVVTYVPDACLVAEMPNSLDAALSQNERWERGRLDVMRRYVPPLARTFMRARGRRRIVYADAITDLVLPPLSVLASVQLLGLTVDTAAALFGRPGARGRAVLGVTALAVLTGHVLAGLRSVRAPASVYRSLAAAPRMIAWKAIIWARALGPRRREVTWQRTQRNAEL
jgi:cellulose synthase/poly-beta-1,6-N-acetylglucosamine synthase-like glycosyltransferase